MSWEKQIPTPHEFAKTMKGLQKDFENDPEKFCDYAIALMCHVLMLLGYREGVSVFRDMEWKRFLEK